ncbi:hypothetical protein CLOM621_06099 [Clostridium sp. M62/1]|nr:hypothetical protein CLOM621_06099 [Clostridium sp. M62/1]
MFYIGLWSGKDTGSGELPQGTGTVSYKRNRNRRYTQKQKEVQRYAKIT